MGSHLNYRSAMSRVKAFLTTTFSPVAIAKRAFHGKRVDYYKYVAGLLKGSGGRLTHARILQDDADRHVGTARGILSAHWAERFNMYPSLSGAYAGTLPEQELSILRVAERSGDSRAIVDAFDDIARIAELVDQSKSEFMATASAGIIAMFISGGALLSLPYLIVPKLQDTFAFVPADRWGPIGMRLVGASGIIDAVAIPFTIGGVALIGFVGWSMSNLVGPARLWLDKRVLLYRLYRDFRGALFVAALASLLRTRGGQAINVRPAVAAIGEESDTWLRWHCDKIIARLDNSGDISAAGFDTGLLDKEVIYFLSDMVSVQGFAEGFQVTGRKVEADMKSAITQRAAVLRWIMLGTALGTVATIAGSMYAFIFEMRSVMSSVM